MLRLVEEPGAPARGGLPRRERASMEHRVTIKHTSMMHHII